MPRKSNPKPKDGALCATRLPADLRRFINSEADKECRTVSAQIRVMLERQRQAMQSQ